MNHALTAEDLYTEMKRMPTVERVHFFSLLANSAFLEDDFTHAQVFGQIHQEPFSAGEAAEYLEISIPTLRRYVQSGKLAPSHSRCHLSPAGSRWSLSYPSSRESLAQTLKLTAVLTSPRISIGV